jgi:CHAT domain-containing protein
MKAVIRGAALSSLLACSGAQASQVWIGYSPSQQIVLSVTDADGEAIASISAPRGVRTYVIGDVGEALVTARASHRMRDPEEISLSTSRLGSFDEIDQELIARLSRLALVGRGDGKESSVVHALAESVARSAACSAVVTDAYVTLGWAQLGIKELGAARLTGQRLVDRCGEQDANANLHGRWLTSESDMRQGHFESAQSGYAELLTRIDIGKLPSEWDWLRLQAQGRWGIACIQYAWTKAAHGIEDCIESLDGTLAQSELAGDYKLSAELLNLMAPYHWSRRDYLAAGETLRRSRLMFQLAETSDGLAGTLNNLALNEGWLGNLGNAQLLLREALELVDAPDLRGSVLLNLARNYQILGELTSAERYCVRALEAFASAESPRGVAQAQTSLGNVFRLRGKPVEALKLHRSALAYYSTETSSQHATALFELAQDQLALNKLADAKFSAAQAQRVASESGVAVILYKASLLAADVELTAGDLAAARALLDESEVSPLPDPPLDARLQRVDLGLRIAAAEKDAALFEIEGQRLLGLIAEVREDLAGGPIELHWINQTGELIDLYLAGVVGGVGTVELEDVFGFVEHNRAIALRARRHSELAEPHLSPAAAEELKVRLQELIAAESQLASASDQQQAAARIAVDEAREAYLAAQATPPKPDAAPELAFVSLAQAQAALDDDQAMLVFHAGTRANFAIVVTRQDAYLKALGSEAELKTSAEQFLAAIQRDDLRSKPSIPALESLFAPLVADSKIKRVVAVTDGVISRLPLSAVHLGGAGYRPLGDAVSLVHSPSVSAYFEPVDAAESFPADIAIFADPAFDADSLASVGAQATYRDWSAGLGRLPQTAREAQKIVERFPAKSITVATGEQATASRLLDPVYTHSRIVHIATHGYYDPATPDIVGLATAPEQINGDPGFLSLSRLHTLRYGARLVVISGCETAMGESIRGEGVNGLARALLAQGADSVIGTLWPVSDAATATFMTEFYSRLADNGGDAAAALDGAQAAFRSSRRHRAPRYWAGFVLLVAGQSYRSVFAP